MVFARTITTAINIFECITIYIRIRIGKFSFVPYFFSLPSLCTIVVVMGSLASINTKIRQNRFSSTLSREKKEKGIKQMRKIHKRNHIYQPSYRYTNNFYCLTATFSFDVYNIIMLTRWIAFLSSHFVLVYGSRRVYFFLFEV